MVVFNGQRGVLLDPGMANMWRRGGARRFDSPDGPVMAVLLLLFSLAPVVVCEVVFFLLFRSTVLFPVLVWITSGGLCSILFLLLWVLFHLGQFGFVGGDCNAEIGFQGVGEESLWAPTHMGGGLGLGINWWNGRRVRTFVFFRPLPNRAVGTRGSTLRVHWHVLPGCS